MKRSNNDQFTPDGGQADIDEQKAVFTRTSDVESLSLADKGMRWLDSYIYTPLVIAWTDIRAKFGITVVFLFLFTGTVGVTIVKEPYVMQAEPFISPFQTLKHPLGTDSMGRDLFGQVVHATPAMIKMIAAGAFFSAGTGTFIGALGGYKGGWLDKVMMSITDIVLVIPALPLVMVIASVYPPKSPFVVGLILGIDNWPTLARTLRSQVLSIREESFTEASRAMGLSKATVLRKDVITNLMPYILVNLANSSRRIIFESVALYYLGILPFTTFNWGVMLNMAYNSGQMNLTNLGQIHWLLVPMIVIILVSMGFMMFAQGLDRIFNVRLRARHAKTKGGEESLESETTPQG